MAKDVSKFFLIHRCMQKDMINRNIYGLLDVDIGFGILKVVTADNYSVSCRRLCLVPQNMLRNVTKLWMICDNVTKYCLGFYIIEVRIMN